MSQIEQALVALIDSRIAAAMQNVGNQQPVQQQAVQQQPAHDPFAGLGGAPVQQQVQTVTPEMIQTLIMPLVANEAIKARLSQEMQAMGIQNLGDAQPAQLPELYNRFQRVANEAQGQAAQQPAATQSGGII